MVRWAAFEILTLLHRVYLQVSLVDPSQDKFCQFLSATLEALSLLLEVTAFSDIGKVCRKSIYSFSCRSSQINLPQNCVKQLLLPSQKKQP